MFIAIDMMRATNEIANKMIHGVAESFEQLQQAGTPVKSSAMSVVMSSGDEFVISVAAMALVLNRSSSIEADFLQKVTSP